MPDASTATAPITQSTQTAQTAQTTTTTADPAAQPTQKYLGKYETADAFRDGLNELHGALGIKPFDKPLFGEGGVFSGPADAETYAKGLKAVFDSNPAARKPKEPVAAKPAEAATATTTAAPATVNPGDMTIKTDDAPTAKGIARILTKAGLVGQEKTLAETFFKDGKLTDDHYKAFEKADLDREVVDAYFSTALAAEQARASAIYTEAEKIAGGSDQHKALRDWAKTLKDDKTFQTLNAAVKTDPSQYPALIGYVDAKYKLTHGTPSNPARGTAPGSAGADIPRSAAEYDALHRAVAAGEPGAMERYAALVKTHGAGFIPGVGRFIQGA